MEFIALLHNIFSKEITNHEYRGYVILSEQHKSISVEQIQVIKWTLFERFWEKKILNYASCCVESEE